MPAAWRSPPCHIVPTHSVESRRSASQIRSRCATQGYFRFRFASRTARSRSPKVPRLVIVSPMITLAHLTHCGETEDCRSVASRSGLIAAPCADGSRRVAAPNRTAGHSRRAGWFRGTSPCPGLNLSSLAGPWLSHHDDCGEPLARGIVRLRSRSIAAIGAEPRECRESSLPATPHRRRHANPGEAEDA
jgi:hypothetical protein